MIKLHRTVLIVEDSAEDRTMLRRYLERARDVEYSCHEAENVADALALCRALAFDIVLVDYGLPDDDGLTFISKAIAEHGPLAFALVVLTGVGDQDIAVEAMKRGAQDYLVKAPQIGQRLLVAVESAIGRVSLLRQLEEQRRELELSNRMLQETLAAQQLSDTRLRIALQAGRMVTWDWDVAEDYVHWSAGLEDLLLLPPSSFNGSSEQFWTQVHPDDRAALLERQNASLRDRTPFEAEFRMLRQDGSVVWLSSRGQTIKDTAGELVRMAGICVDITERKLLEATLLEERALLARRVEERTADLSAANAELARASRLKDEFLASMSHELRTPLNAVLGLSEALQEEVYGPLNDRQHRSLRGIEESGRHLLELINDILDLAKIGAGKLELDLQAQPVLQVAEASLRMVRQSAYSKRIQVHANLDPAVSSMVVDARRLRQILVNLLSNAVKFTPTGGQIGLELHGDAANQTVSFTVWDTGIGIGQEQMEQLFQPFVQLDSRLARQYEGTGLGLALVYRMAEMHGGMVNVASEVGVGSRFTVTLPWQREITPTPEIALPTEALGRAGAPRHALVIEDSATAAEQIVRYLTELGIATSVQPVGIDAVKHALSLGADMVVLDILLPELSGWDVLKQLKADERTASLPVLVVSVVDDRARAVDLGAAGTLVKPITRDIFYEAVQSIAAGETRSGGPDPAPAAPIVLLAEDNEASIVTVADFLGARGYHVIVARNGQEAVLLARETRPAVVLMDMQMPVLDGLEATRQIRQDTSLQAVPIIALTALAMPGDRERCLAAGANEYLSKPIRLKELAETIGTFLA